MKKALEHSLEHSSALDRGSVVSLTCLLLLAPEAPHFQLLSADALKRLRTEEASMSDLAWSALLAHLICKGAFPEGIQKAALSLERFSLGCLLRKEGSAQELLFALLLIKLAGGCLELEERVRLALPSALKEGGPGLFVPALARCCGIPVPGFSTSFVEIFDRELKIGASPERLASILWAFSSRNKIGLEERLELLAEKCLDEKFVYLLALAFALKAERVEKPSLSSVVFVGKKKKSALVKSNINFAMSWQVLRGHGCLVLCAVWT